MYQMQQPPSHTLLRKQNKVFNEILKTHFSNRESCEQTAKCSTVYDLGIKKGTTEQKASFLNPIRPTAHGTYSDIIFLTEGRAPCG
jgi:hypothetical protein